jgi:mRNA-degrading endonuclease RelE of RelBE toxin-antitoxin system
MRWTVVYHRRAEDELARIWLFPTIRQAVTDAAAQVDQILRDSPLEAGESRASGRRILLVPPLGVKFEVSEPDRIVRVLDVWHIEKHRPRS